jgi:hypothetical protein
MQTTNPIEAGENTIDREAIAARISALESELIEAKDGESEAAEKLSLEEWLENAAADDRHTFQDSAKELVSLKSLSDDCGTCAGQTLILDTHFEDFARETAADFIGREAIDAWPCSHIDWSAAANALRQDYHACEFDGYTYLIRS